jgi:chromosome segregation ATPase
MTQLTDCEQIWPACEDPLKKLPPMSANREIEEKIHLISWRDSLAEQLQAKIEDDQSKVKAIQELKASIAETTTLIRKLLKQQTENKSLIATGQKEKQQKAHNSKLSRAISDLTFAEGIEDDNDQLAFDIQPFDSPFTAYLHQFEQFESQCQARSQYLDQAEKVYADVLSSIEICRNEIVSIDQELAELPARDDELANLEEQIRQTRTFVQRLPDLDAQYGRLRSELDQLRRMSNHGRKSQHGKLNPSLKRQYREQLERRQDVIAAKENWDQNLSRFIQLMDKLRPVQ